MKSYFFSLQDYDYTEAFKFTPAAVAEYLFRSGEFKELEEALADLVNSSIVSHKIVFYRCNTLFDCSQQTLYFLSKIDLTQNLIGRSKVSNLTKSY